MAKHLRCYMCSDLHAANRTYRKLLNAIKMNVYEAHVVLIGRMIRTTARQPARACGKVHLNQVGNVDAGDVAAAGFRRLERGVLEHEQVDQPAELGVLRIFAEQ